MGGRYWWGEKKENRREGERRDHRGPPASQLLFTGENKENERFAHPQ